ncbi:piggyBac transposable element-derived protein 3-like [Spodoptera litura]|uniref:PiggyBac transposable element-derived protein 3-like n=1 Tax=Spodoptera litura TaxID=69820 RepID=A0A9J7DTL4_SPOLT|nr:piggyBac transposable element-derived protein 3-like [Spodoptera litura]
MDPVQKKYKNALKVSEIVDYLQDIEDFSDEELNDIEIAILPPDAVDEMTDIEEGPDDDMGVLPVSDVAGQVEFSCTIDSGAENHPTQTTSRTSRTVTWRKCEPVYSEIQPESNTAKQCLENMITQLEGKSAVEIFENLLCDGILEYIVHETVSYAKHYKNDLNFNLTINELKVFIGILFFSSYHHLPQSKLYWCRDEDVHIPFVEQAMSRNRFDKIKSYLHFNDNSQIDNTDKAFKIRPLIDKANESFRKFGIFESNLAVDEMIVKYFGHHGIKQFIKGKDVQTSASHNDGLGATVVKKLLAVCTAPRAHVVYFDNFFSSMQLLIDLKSQGFRATGTCWELYPPLLRKSQLRPRHG